MSHKRKSPADGGEALGEEDRDDKNKRNNNTKNIKKRKRSRRRKDQGEEERKRRKRQQELKAWSNGLKQKPQHKTKMIAINKKKSETDEEKLKWIAI